MSNNDLYTKRDVEDIRKYLIEQVTEMTDEWTDFNESDLGMVFIELAAGLGDMLGFYIDQQRLESLLPTAKQRKNAKSLLKLINYKMSMTQSAVVSGTFNTNHRRNDPVIIPKYTQVMAPTSSGNVYYATAQETVIPYRSDTIPEESIKFIQGIVHTIYLTVGELRGRSRIDMLTENVAQDSVTISIDDEDWEEVDDIFTELNQDKKFSVDEDKDDNPFILLSRDIDKFLPKSDDAPVVIKYLTSQGPEGRVKKGAITRVVSTLYTDTGDTVSDVTVTNLTSSSGGAYRESIESARKNAPKYLTASSAAITLEDYEALALKHPSVSRAKAIDWNLSSNLVDMPYMINIYVVPKDGSVPNEVLLNDIRDTLESKRITSMKVSVLPPEYFFVDVNITVRTSSSVERYYEIESEIVKRVQDYFDPNNIDFQSGIYSSNLSTLAETSDASIISTEVKLIDQTREEGREFSNINLEMNQFPRLLQTRVNIVSDR